MDRDTADRVNAVVLDVMSAFRNAVELYWHTPQLVEAAGFGNFEDWVRAQPKPQLTNGERKALAAEYTVELGMTQREAAAALGVSTDTIQRDSKPAFAVPNATIHEADELDDAAFAVPPAVKEEPDESGGPQWDVLQDIRNRISALAAFPPKVVAAQVPARRRAATARELRRLGTTLARVVLALEA